MNTLPHKGYGRIYCLTEADIPKVEKIIKEMSEFEHSYMPAGMIGVFTEYPRVIYTHKFSDLDTDALTATCWARGIPVWVFDSGNAELPKNDIGKTQ